MIRHKSIIALDLRNATIDNLENWFTSTKYVHANATKNYLRNRITTLNNSDNFGKTIFIINDQVFGLITKNNDHSVYFTTELKNELMKFAIPIQLEELEIYRSALIDWIFNFNQKNSQLALALSTFQKYDNKDLMLYGSFITCVTTIAVEELGFTLRNFFAPLNQNFKAILQEFKNHYRRDKYLNTIKLTSIFIIDGFILGYCFRLENETAEHFFWNTYFEEQLLLLDCFTFNEEKIMSINDVLDKINNIGLDNLTENDFEILKNS